MMDTQWCNWYPDDELIGMLRVHSAHPDFDRDPEMQNTVREIIADMKPRLKDWLAYIEYAEDELAKLKG